MSRYREIATAIEKDIIEKKYVDKLPEQFYLADKYHTSRVTIVHALKLLSQKHLIKTVKGHGTYILSKEIPNIFLNSGTSENDGFTKHINGSGVVSSHIISFQTRKPTHDEACALNISPKEQVYDIIRQRLLDNHSAKLEYTVMPVTRIPGLNRDILHRSIYSYIQDNLGLKIGKDDRIIAADKADAYDMQYLNCRSDDPVLCVKQNAYLEDGTPFEISESRNRYDRGVLTVNNS
ncbi:MULTISPECIES: GntR family transcriptional regulator [Lactobacillus]|uniref:GntR family transcriptional regulator n=1 Tax=Lactobacillus xujianguonis TaxID=2495899 RepID=A0A437SUM0_9LACO|nr:MULTISPECIES: GntR family transcriptional regulator [Lactobacillus]RVU70638.1 GntR family transcriptional regulator [Lactobacillus xujianguonis]RVU73825.1 GntR family transcriptional regulator [Lactobacillus xujianguonis]